jgi:predicted MFS family arabinose efflux permease
MKLLISLKLQFLSGVYNGIGRSTGAIVGGKLQSEVGTASTFMYGAITNALFASLLILYCTVYERTKMHSSKKDK